MIPAQELQHQLYDSDYSILCAKLHVQGPTEELKEAFATLAEKGHLRSLAKYFSLVKPIDRKEILSKIGAQIGTKDWHKFSPEEWEIMAQKRRYDLQSVEGFGRLTIDEIMTKLVKENQYSIYIRDEYDHGRASVSAVKKANMNLINLFDAFKNSMYAFCIRKAQNGYYKKIFNEFRLLDASSYLELSTEPNNFVSANQDELKRLSGGRYYTRQNICAMAKKAYARIEHSKEMIDFSDRYSYYNCLIYGNGSGKEVKAGKKGMQKIDNALEVYDLYINTEKRFKVERLPKEMEDFEKK